MATVAAVRHVAFEDLGILETLFAKRGDTVVYFDAPVANFTDSALQEADLLVVLGAPIGAFDDALYPFLSAEAECIRRRVASDKAVLGICLGAQLIARVLGAQVNPMGVKEIGFKPLELTNEGKQSPLRHLAGVPVLHWHGDCFGLPQGATSLAYTNVSHERGFSLGGKLLSLELSMESEIYCEQAFSVGNKVLGLQFHLEADTDKIEYWLVGHACELVQAEVDLQQIRNNAKREGQRLQAAAWQTMTEWLDAALT